MTVEFEGALEAIKALLLRRAVEVLMVELAEPPHPIGACGARTGDDGRWCCRAPRAFPGRSRGISQNLPRTGLRSRGARPPPERDLLLAGLRAGG